MYFIADIMNGVPINSDSIDLVVADPPFNIKFNGKPGTYNRKKHNIASYQEYTENLAIKSAEEIYRVLKPAGTVWIVMGWNSLRLWENAFANFNQIGHVIWKYQFGVYTKKRPVTSHYHLLIYTKSKKEWVWNRIVDYDEDVWYIKRPYKFGGFKYANKLPDKLVKNIILRSSNIGDIIYDPFVGSGTTVRVAEQLERVGIGSDIKDNSKFWKQEGY